MTVMPVGGTLYVVATPIGNLEDITLRALRVLKSVQLVAAEDTRRTGILLRHFGIEVPITSVHEHNERARIEKISGRLAKGESVALVTDAGTPGISDPAFLLVRECVKRDIRVECLPGATAFIPALVNSGLPINSFCFEGFLPLKKGRQTFLKKMAEEERTMVFYESPMRLVKTLHNFIEYFGAERQCCVSRELTKKFEENKRGTLQEVHDHFNAKPVKGEIVIVVAGK